MFTTLATAAPARAATGVFTYELFLAALGSGESGSLPFNLRLISVMF